ncbi:HAD-IIB family hydrolase [Lysinibacillus fusiformis]|nr:HAD-IIB family hydrolase [Lysinibacillus fusiformis]
MKLLSNEILATDLDNTLVGHKEKLDQLWYYFKSQKIPISLIYITGRHYSSAMKLIEEHNLPKPNILICDVGATIYIGENLEEDDQWRLITSADWNPDLILSVIKQYSGLKRQQLPNNYRLSFTIEDDPGYVKEVEEMLRLYCLAFYLMYSSNKDVDILPSHTNKGEALKYALQKYAPEQFRILVAGDSGNDVDMLRLGLPAVIVGNCQNEIKRYRYLPNVYFAKDSFASGIQEGWNYFYQSAY